ncbi:Cell-division control histidine kinase PdhS [compost metagenome]
MTSVGHTTAISHYDPILVVLSVVIAISAGYTALDMTGRVALTQGLTRKLWLAGGALALGLGIWSMHFTGMLAFRVGEAAMTYDLTLTVASMLVAIAASWWALWVASRRRVGIRNLLAGGLLMGLGICSMHYVGMAAMRMPTVISYNPWLVAASLLIAIGGSIAALWLAFRLRNPGASGWMAMRLGSAALVGIAIAGMHYVGMAAARFSLTPTPTGAPVLQIGSVGGAAIASGTLLILMIVLLGSYRQRMEDVVTRKAYETLQKAEQEFRGILEASPDPTILVNPEGRITLASPQTEKVFGYRQDELLGQSVEILMPERFRSAHGRHLSGFFKSPRMRPMGSGLELSAQRKDGTEFPIEVSLSPLESNEQPAVLAVIRDITERKQAEAAIAQRSAELEKANEALRTADRYKDEFLSVISHELRTPLNFITGFASILDDEVAGPLNETQQSYIRKIMNGADRMLELVNNLLDMSRIQAGKLHIEPEPSDYAPIVVEALAPLRPLTDQKQLTLTQEVQETPQLVIDPRRMTQVLTNLVDNAIKFTPKGGRITVRVRPIGDEVLTEVIDTGPGIDEEGISKLFRPFSQVDMSSTRRVGGTGLGLTISKAFVEAHGGQIGVHSRPGEGSTFWFTLPIPDAPSLEG